MKWVGQSCSTNLSFCVKWRLESHGGVAFFQPGWGSAMSLLLFPLAPRFVSTFFSLIFSLLCFFAYVLKYNLTILYMNYFSFIPFFPKKGNIVFLFVLCHVSRKVLVFWDHSTSFFPYFLIMRHSCTSMYCPSLNISRRKRRVHVWFPFYAWARPHLVLLFPSNILILLTIDIDIW